MYVFIYLFLIPYQNFHQSLCLSSLSGGQDEQKGLAAVRRICEEYREARGNIMYTSESAPAHTYTHIQTTQTRARTHISVQLLSYANVWR